MKPYQGRQGDSGIAAFQSGPDYIILEFKDGSRYLYNSASAGARHLAAMKRLAEAQDGLNTYLNKYVKDRFAEKIC